VLVFGALFVRGGVGRGGVVGLFSLWLFGQVFWRWRAVGLVEAVNLFPLDIKELPECFVDIEDCIIRNFSFH
jgi:hypothetical protein